jgi:TetR/AcrR family transcriptional regulator, mexJK operon transcriptional repressor
VSVDAEEYAALPEDRRWARKHRAITDAAAALFLEHGYLGTSMDDLAAQARVSKQTIYKHFGDKESLFIEMVTTIVDEISDPVHEEVLALQDTGDIAADLRDLARRQIASVMTPRLLALRRLVIAEAARFPELGRAFYERGPGRTIASLAATFERLGARGRLAPGDWNTTAAQFNWLVMSEAINRAMLLGPGTPVGDLTRQADDGVRAFLAVYGVPG